MERMQYSYQQCINLSRAYHIYMTYISCLSREWYKNRTVRPIIENLASARASGSFWSKYLLHKKTVLSVLPEK